jgi:hypothetical protein
MSVERKRREYLAAAWEFLDGKVAAESFATRFTALARRDRIAWETTPWPCLGWFRDAMADGARHPQGLAYWLSSTVPTLVEQLGRSSDEVEVMRRLKGLWGSDGYFEPASSAPWCHGVCEDLFATGDVRAILAAVQSGQALWGDFDYTEAVVRATSSAGKEALYWAHVLDPDNAMSSLVWVRRASLPADALAGLRQLFAVPADQGGSSLMALVPASLVWIVGHAWDPGAELRIYALGLTLPPR